MRIKCQLLEKPNALGEYVKGESSPSSGVCEVMCYDWLKDGQATAKPHQGKTAK